MPRSADRNLLRLGVRVGEIAIRDSRLVRIEARLRNGRVRIQDLATGEIEDVHLGELRARSTSSDKAEADSRLETNRSVLDPRRQAASARERTLSTLFEGQGP